MEQTSVSAWKSSLSYGLWLGISLVIISIGLYATGNIFSNSAGWITYAVMISGIIIAQIQYRNQLGGIMTYSQALGIGVLTMIFASVIAGFFTYMLYAVIDPSLQNELKLAIEEQIAKQDIPEEQFEMAVKMMNVISSPAMLFFRAILEGAFAGLLFSLVTSIFTQKKPVGDFS